MILSQHRSLLWSNVSGNTVSQDRRFIDKYMPDLGAWLHYRTVDVSTIKELTRRWYPEVRDTTQILATSE